VDLTTRFSGEPLIVTGSRSQLEQAFNMFLQYAEKAAAEAKERKLSVSTARAANRAVVEIGWSSKPGLLEPDVFGPAQEAGALSLAVCRNVIHTHGGEIRLLRTSSTQSRFEVELPVAATEPAETTGPAAAEPAAVTARQLTALVVEPDAALRTDFVRMVSDHGHRVVPVASAEEAADMAVRVHFDVIFCATHLTNLNWIDLFDRVGQQTSSFVLLTDSLSPDPIGGARTTHVPTLGRPVDGRELARILTAVTARVGTTEG
jgi:CheY-like chemotaxis protein